MVTAEMGTKVPFRRLEVPRTECGLAAPMSGVVRPRGVWVARNGGGLDPGSFARAGRARGSRPDLGEMGGVVDTCSLRKGSEEPMKGRMARKEFHRARARSRTATLANRERDAI